ncbi:MAG: hypothetical protein LBI15_04390 [Dysgonamonadaceae bacterium]|jgi:hypothetical protein|nr:hypothetical protein [Dysgonamonadaceae bacterium]
MKKILPIILSALLIGLAACTTEKRNNVASNIPETQITSVINQLKENNPSANAALTLRIERGVRQVANLWRESDGTAAEFAEFCKTSFVADADELATLFNTLERNFEIIQGYLHTINVHLNKPLHLDVGTVTPLDMMFAGYNISANLTDDMFATKIAFKTALNFPFYSLEEKTKLGETWTRTEWAYARMGDRFISRVPASVQQNISRIFTDADAYISDYNIYMGRLLNDDNQTLFPENMRLISHWGLRDELRSNYADLTNGLEKQRMIYQVMQRIIDQSIPQQVVNSGTYTWNPFSNNVYNNSTTIATTREPDTRYEVFLNNINAMKTLDPYSPSYPTQVIRAFDQVMEIPLQDVETLFRGLLSSPQAREVAALISSRIGRPLEPFDIWYTGFRSSGGIPEEELTALTQRKFPNAQAYKADIPRQLEFFGWSPGRAKDIASLIVVEGSRGAGHAWGSRMRNDVARLRTRIEANGMDYKGFNIGVHELGHNVEQTITMNDVDYYSLTGVPNTAFTEAVAFLFQRADIDLLGLENNNPEAEHYLALQKFWACFEIMGVSLVDVTVWQWMYENPNATPAQLRETVMRTAKDVWNTYYADIFGVRDQTILAIYSHMIMLPIYLPNYPMGHLIDFQIAQYMEGKNIADEIDRMFTQGSIIPQLWMQRAVGSKISIEPLLQAAQDTVNALK